MGKATWKGEEATPDLQETTRFGIVFKKGEAVEVPNEEHLRKLASNPNFTVENGDPEKPPLQVPPSQQPAQMSAPKPGEPVRTPTPAPRK